MSRPASAGLALCAPADAMERLYGAHVEAGVGASVESHVDSDDGRRPLDAVDGLIREIDRPSRAHKSVRTTSTSIPTST